MKAELPLRPALAQVWQELGHDEARFFALLRRFYRAMEKDVMIGFFFLGRDLDAIADKQGEFLLRAMGARPTYSGKSPADAHASLPPIRRGMFDRRLVILRETLTQEGLSPASIEAWVAFENTFREAVEG